MTDSTTLVLRLAAPIQSWGGRSQYNRRETLNEPTKGGILGLLAAADGRRRSDPIEDLLRLRLGVRTDQPGTLMRDYHTVSDYRGVPLLSAAISGKGTQKPTSPAKHVHVTQRYYLQDAVFVAAVSGIPDTVRALREALRRPAYPLALGRRSCVPTHPLVLDPPDMTPDGLWQADLAHVLGAVAWQASPAHQRTVGRTPSPPPQVHLPITIDDPAGDDIRTDVPRSFDPLRRELTSRRVRQDWVTVATPFTAPESAPANPQQDPFALLEW
ncbi:MAG TPA: type I-E CRISPR-associated protein Cas5/CasD [Kineosporiaceae bacterium]